MIRETSDENSALTNIPESISVAVDLLFFIDNKNVKTTAKIPKVIEIIWTDKAGTDIIIAIAAPNPAPFETPSVYGSARGFLKMH